MASGARRTGCWAPWLALFFAAGASLLAAGAPAAADVNEKTAQLLEALESALTEDAARGVLEPYLDNLKGLDAQVVEKVVLRQWWELARDIISRSHTQQVDLSFAIRRAVRTLKDEADELLRTLNPKYGLAQQVSPAFQWAQNDTCIFLSIKYTVRWNAPGALEVTEPAVVMQDNLFNFTGLGKHSNNKYRYTLSLNLFDRINPQVSSWSAASVGKLSVTLRKSWTRKWPRLLANKKAKIGNMHVWMEMQEKLDSTLGGLSSVSNSPITCAAGEKLYCVATDTCKKPANCTQCPGKTTPKLELSICAGLPSESASLSFKDADMDENEISGDIKILKAKNDFDIDAYVIYFGKDTTSKLLDAAGNPIVVGEVAPTGQDVELKLPAGTTLPEGATHLLVFSRNEYGEYSSPGSLLLKDAVLPKSKPGGVTFEDDDGDKGKVGGRVSVLAASNPAQIEQYSLHWGKSPTRKSGGMSFIADIKADGSLTHWISLGTKPPDGATHILVFSKNEHGEHPSPASTKFVDNTKPCLQKEDEDCPVQVTVSPDEDADPQQLQAKVVVTPGKNPTGVTQYKLYWGRQGCENGGQLGAKNGILRDIDVPAGSTGPVEVEVLEHTPILDGSTHILVFASNGYGESEWCVSTEFQDNRGAEAERKEL